MKASLGMDGWQNMWAHWEVSSIGMVSNKFKLLVWNCWTISQGTKKFYVVFHNFLWILILSYRRKCTTVKSWQFKCANNGLTIRNGLSVELSHDAGSPEWRGWYISSNKIERCVNDLISLVRNVRWRWFALIVLNSTMSSAQGQEYNAGSQL